MKRITINRFGNVPLTTGLRKSGIFIRRELVKALTTGKRTGRIYRINGRNHQASAPGEIPAKLSGRLAKSVGYTVATKRLTIGEGMFYAKFLEYGTSRMQPRPHLAVTVERLQEQVSVIIGDEIRSVF